MTAPFFGFACALLVGAPVIVGCGESIEPESTGAREADRIFLAGGGELWVVDSETGDSRHLRMRNLGGGDAPHQILASDGRLAIWGFDIYGADAAHPRESVQPITRRSWIMVPGSSPDSVWVGYLSPEATAHERLLGELREFDFEGNVLRRGVEPPGGKWPIAGMSSGLLFWAGGHVFLWDPDTARVARSYREQAIGSPGPVYEDTVASCENDPCPRIRLTDFVTGAVRHFRAPRGRWFQEWDASFSPDGQKLALVVAGERDTGSKRKSPLGILDIDSGRLEIIPRSDSSGYRFIRWSPDGARVYVAGGESQQRRYVKRFELGDDRAELVYAGRGDFYDMAVD